jgi:hypothetical protein
VGLLSSSSKRACSTGPLFYRKTNAMGSSPIHEYLNPCTVSNIHGDEYSRLIQSSLCSGDDFSVDAFGNLDNAVLLSGDSFNNLFNYSGI